MTVSSQSLGRRLLHSSLLEALAYPHGVDRYVELVRPLLVKGEARAEVTAVHRQTVKSVTLTLCPNENWSGILARIPLRAPRILRVAPSSSRSRRIPTGGSRATSAITHGRG
jgi:hypothetical protein